MRLTDDRMAILESMKANDQMIKDMSSSKDDDELKEFLMVRDIFIIYDGRQNRININ